MADIDCSDTAALLSEAKAFSCCIPEGMMPAVQTYLLMQIAGLDLTPDQLLQEAKCFKCIPAGQMQEVQAWMLCNIANA